MEEIKESEDSTDNKIISNSTLLSEGSPSGLTKDIKPGLNSSTKNHKNITKEEIPEDVFMHSVRPTREICLPIQIAPASNWNNFTKLEVLLDLGTNAIFTDKAWAKKHQLPLTPLASAKYSGAVQHCTVCHSQSQPHSVTDRSLTVQCIYSVLGCLIVLL